MGPRRRPAGGSHLLKKLQREGLTLSRALGEVSRSETRDLFQHRAWEILEAITPADIEKASLRDKVLSAAIATDKALLLDGQPTEILSIKQMENLDELAGMMLAEAKRRGQTPRVNEADQTVVMEKSVGVGERGDPTRDAWAPTDEPS